MKFDLIFVFLFQSTNICKIFRTSIVNGYVLFNLFIQKQ